MHRSLRRLCAAVLLCAGLLAAPTWAQRVPFNPGDDNFSADGLLKGVSATAQQCAAVPNAVWAQASTGDAECIRYWAAGFTPGVPAPRALVYIPGDQMAFDQPDPGYTRRNPRNLQAAANDMQARAGVPFILLSRPGMFGSSGDHRERRREGEVRIVSAALDQIKARDGIQAWSLAGLSGGGHTVAALLGWRSDIVCAVAASSVSSPRLRWQGMGRTTDLTGHADSYEPVDHLKREVFHPELRVFVLGDPQDSNVVFVTQTPLADKLKTLGAAVEVVQAEGTGPQRHFLGDSSQRLGAMCLRGLPTPQILQAARGMKG